MEKNDGKKQYSSIVVAIYEYNKFDVIRTSAGLGEPSGTYDSELNEWYDSDVQWGGL